MHGFDDDLMATMLGDFLDESEGHLRALNENLLQIDELVRLADDDRPTKVDLDRLNEMFRAAHSLKGLSAMLGLGDINRLTHKIENVFDAARQNQLSLTGSVVDLLLQGVDRLASMIDGLKEHDAGEVEYQSVVDEIQTLLQSAGVAREHKSQAEIAEIFSAENESLGKAPVTVEHIALGQSPIPSSITQSAPVVEIDHFAEVADDADIPEKYISIFVDETEQSLDQLAESLLSERPNGAVDELLIVCHRIKGSAASIGLHCPAKLAHFMEDMLQDLRERGATLSATQCDAMLASTDALRQYIVTLRAGARNATDFSGAYHKLLQARKLAAPAERMPKKTPIEKSAPSTSDATSPDAALRAAAIAAIPPMARALVGAVHFEENLPLAELKAKLICNRVARFGDLVHFDPPENELDSAKDLRLVAFAVVGEGDAQSLRRELQLDGIESVRIDTHIGGVRPESECRDQNAPTPTTAFHQATHRCVQPTRAGAPSSDAPGTAPATAPSTSSANTSKQKPAETLRVEIERLDQLMSLAGELVINKARFGQLGERLKALIQLKQANQSLASALGMLGCLICEIDLAGDSQVEQDALQSARTHARQMRADLESVRHELAQIAQARLLVNELSEAVHQLDRVSDGIQKSVMDTRMVPIGPLFGRFKRVIRDITRSNGKDIQLLIRGENTELDKRMIDELGDPLVHMVRNAADHGVESPVARAAAGKPPQGVVTLDAFHRGNRILIQVRDDGRGLDPQKLRDKAVAKGILSELDAERLTDHQAFQLIWEPGFSTAEQITEVSGRGMGMDIVRSKIEDLNGTIELDSKLGKGTTFTIKLPLTVAILPSLLTEVDGAVFAVPVESIVEIVRVRGTELATVHGLLTARVRGRVISVVEFSDLFDNDRFRHDPALTRDGATLVIIGVEGRELGLVVTHLMGEQDIVIKSISENYRNVEGIAGASILGDGRVALIFDTGALVELACRRTPVRENEVLEAIA